MDTRKHTFFKHPNLHVSQRKKNKNPKKIRTQTGKLLVRRLHADSVSPINSQILESERDRMAIDGDWSRNIVPADCELIIVIVSAWVRYYPIQWHCSQWRPKATHHPEYCLKWAVFKVRTLGLDPADRKRRNTAAKRKKRGTQTSSRKTAAHLPRKDYPKADGHELTTGKVLEVQAGIMCMRFRTLHENLLQQIFLRDCHNVFRYSRTIYHIYQQPFHSKFTSFVVSSLKQNLAEL